MDRRLTLVIDPANGAPVVTRYIQSSRADLDSAVTDLGQREGTGTREIGYLNLTNETSRSVHPPLMPVIREWSMKHGFEGVVWTDLSSNFQEKIGEPFSVEEARDYLLHLPRFAADRARRYFTLAPPEVDTPLRRGMREAGWLKPTRIVH
jgi:hypothetical protein